MPNMSRLLIHWELQEQVSGELRRYLPYIRHNIIQGG